MNHISTMSLAVALAGTLAILSMAGCGDTPGTTAQPSTTTMAPDKTAPAPAAPATPAPVPKHGCCQ